VIYVAPESVGSVSIMDWFAEVVECYYKRCTCKWIGWLILSHKCFC